MKMKMELYLFIKWFVMDFIDGCSNFWSSYRDGVESEPITFMVLTLFGTIFIDIVIAGVLGFMFNLAPNFIGSTVYIVTCMIWINYVVALIVAKYQQFKLDFARHKKYQKELEESNVTKEN